MLGYTVASTYGTCVHLTLEGVGRASICRCGRMLKQNNVLWFGEACFTPCVYFFCAQGPANKQLSLLQPRASGF
jgi:hypothetical protein